MFRGLADQFRERLSAHVPRSFEWIVEVGQHEVREEQQQGGDGDGERPEDGLRKGKNSSSASMMMAVRFTNSSSVRGMRFTLSASLSSRRALRGAMMPD